MGNRVKNTIFAKSKKNILKIMDLKEILAITGKKGLYKVVSHEKSRIIVESLLDNARMPVFPSSRPSALENITIFTEEKDMPLEKVFKKIFETTQGGKVQENRIANDVELKKYMEEILPQYDKTRVYVSDMKKIFVWYNILLDNDLLSFEDENEETESDANIDTE